ncbi:phage virion morphogenesis protein [Ottowia sp.]|uniref:phage virion morphogenesis protein n=1 Tax=Ottowia sp. TaxID=1898956 RepID=UPI003A8C5D15
MVIDRSAHVLGDVATVLYLLRSTQDRFKLQIGPDGGRWAAPKRLSRKKKHKDKILALQGFCAKAFAGRPWPVCLVHG